MNVIRKPLQIAAVGIAFAGVLAACGGGSSPAPSIVSATPPIGANMQTNTVNGASSEVTVSIAIPHHTTNATTLAVTRARIQALHGKKTHDASIRTMANTGATAAVRAVGAKLNAWATAYEKATGRSPDYVSPASYYMEFVVYSGTTLVQDGYSTCSVQSSTCSGTFTVPVGTGYTVSLYLYDSCYYLLSAGVTQNFSVVSGTNPTLTITLDPVVAYIDLTATPTNFVNGVAQSVNISVNPLDAEYFNSGQDNTVTTPGVLITGQFVPITAVTISLGSTYTDVSPSAPQTIPVPTPAQSPPTAYTIGPVAYNYGATGPETDVDWGASLVATGNPIITTTPSGPYGGGYSTPYGNGSIDIPVQAKSLSFVATSGQTIPTIDNMPAYQIEDGTSQDTLEFAIPPPPGTPVTVFLTVAANFDDAGAPLQLSNDSCSNHPNGGIAGSLATPFPSPGPEATMGPGGTYAFTFQASSLPGGGPCSFDITEETNNLTHLLYLGFDTTTLNVQGKARSK